MTTDGTCEVVQEMIGHAQSGAVYQHLAGENRPLVRDVRVVRYTGQLNDDGWNL